MFYYSVNIAITEAIHQDIDMVWVPCSPNGTIHSMPMAILIYSVLISRQPGAHAQLWPLTQPYMVWGVPCVLSTHHRQLHYYCVFSTHRRPCHTYCVLSSGAVAYKLFVTWFPRRTNVASIRADDLNPHKFHPSFGNTPTLLHHRA